MIMKTWLWIAGALALAGCEANHADTIAPIVPGKDAGGSDGVAANDTDSPPQDAASGDAAGDASAGLTCEDLSIKLSEELAKHAPSYDGCTKDSQCELIDPQIECKNALGQVVTTLVDCPVAVSSPPLPFAEATLTIRETLCPIAPDGCVATPSCAPIEPAAVCESGRCKTVPTTP